MANAMNDMFSGAVQAFGQRGMPPELAGMMQGLGSGLANLGRADAGQRRAFEIAIAYLDAAPSSLTPSDG
jgi:hypothetical protein